MSLQMTAKAFRPGSFLLSRPWYLAPDLGERLHPIRDAVVHASQTCADGSYRNTYRYVWIIGAKSPLCDGGARSMVSRVGRAVGCAVTPRRIESEVLCRQST
jgi:hypothetical protein